MSSYKIETSVKAPIRILQLSDLHCSEFDEKNTRLIEFVKEQSPDIILMTGDMINRDEDDISVATNLISSLTEIAPVYYGHGNHEYQWMERTGKDLRQEITDAGAVLLDNNYVDIEIKGNKLRIGGYMGYYRIPWMFERTEEEKKEEYSFFDDFENTDRYKILINHIPTQWVDWDYTQHPVDLVFSGHYHGGQWVLPGIGAVYAPYIGFNPPNVKGVFHGKYATCILSTGLGSEHWYLPRINNPPEVVVVDLVPNKDGEKDE
ncbi:MAG: metallophosphoesterase [Eubacterium sp.]|nr:metallophosphoesterase [Eubacterium sp.]